MAAEGRNFIQAVPGHVLPGGRIVVVVMGLSRRRRAAWICSTCGCAADLGSGLS